MNGKEKRTFQTAMATRIGLLTKAKGKERKEETRGRWRLGVVRTNQHPKALSISRWGVHTWRFCPLYGAGGWRASLVGVSICGFRGYKEVAFVTATADENDKKMMRA